MKLRSRAVAVCAAAAATTSLVPGIAQAETKTPIDHVVVIYSENISFDHYFGTMPGVRGFDDPDALRLPDGSSVFDQPTRPDVVWLFRRPILEEWIERGDVGLARLIAHVLVHEIAHPLGWSDDDIRGVDDWTL